ncbi:hypothetical protein TRVL_06306 [Trypanosoma vivax]|nr:hypothetical protein TRVL_06306 [Trypanosoma vivax]
MRVPPNLHELPLLLPKLVFPSACFLLPVPSCCLFLSRRAWSQLRARAVACLQFVASLPLPFSFEHLHYITTVARFVASVLVTCVPLPAVRLSFVFFLRRFLVLILSTTVTMLLSSPRFGVRFLACPYGPFAPPLLLHVG